MLDVHAVDPHVGLVKDAVESEPAGCRTFARPVKSAPVPRRLDREIAVG